MTNWIANKKRKCRKIGTKFTTSVGTFEVVEATDKCEGCFMHRDTPDKLNQCKHNAFSRQLAGACKAQARKDGKYVIFKKIEKDMETKEIIKRVFTADKYEIEVITNFGEYSATEFRYNTERRINDFGVKEFSMDGMFKCDETTFSIIAEKILNPPSHDDMFITIHCREKEREVIAHCLFSGVYYNDDSSPDKIEVFVERVEEKIKK